jgi:predicted metal-binding membrane protein
MIAGAVLLCVLVLLQLLADVWLLMMLYYAVTTVLPLLRLHMPEYRIVLEGQSVGTYQIILCHGNVACTSAFSTARRLGQICANRATYEMRGFSRCWARDL